MFQFIPRTDTN